MKRVKNWQKSLAFNSIKPVPRIIKTSLKCFLILALRLKRSFIKEKKKSKGQN